MLFYFTLDSQAIIQNLMQLLLDNYFVAYVKLLVVHHWKLRSPGVWLQTRDKVGMYPENNVTYWVKRKVKRVLQATGWSMNSDRVVGS